MIQAMGDRLPPASSVPGEAYELARDVRDLVAAVAATDVGADAMAAASARIREVTDSLRAVTRAPLQLVRHPDGSVESLRNAGSGALNPQSPPLEWLRRPAPPPPGSTPVPTEVRARCTFGAAYAGSPGCVYGGVLALVMDEVTGIAIHASGATGMTVSLHVSLRGPVPLGVPVEITATYTGSERRKSFASGTMTVDGREVVSAEVIYVAERTATPTASSDPVGGPSSEATGPAKEQR